MHPESGNLEQLAIIASYIAKKKKKKKVGHIYIIIQAFFSIFLFSFRILLLVSNPIDATKPIDWLIKTQIIINRNIIGFISSRLS